MTNLRNGRVRAVVLAATLVLAGLATPAAVASAAPPKPTVVLVHGAWADASSWAKVTTRLQRKGYPVLAVPNHLPILSEPDAVTDLIVTADRATR